MTSVESILADLNANGVKYTSNNGDTQAREKLLSNARALIAELETPAEFVMRTTWAEPARNIAAMVALDTGLFKQLKSASSSEGVSTTKMAEATGVQEDVVNMMMRHLAAMDIVRESGPDHFAATRMSSALLEPSFTGGMYVCVDCLTPAFASLREYIKENQWQLPNVANNGAVQKAFNMDKQVYQYITEDWPEMAQHFHNFMTGYRLGIPKWFNKGFYPWQERLGHAELDDASLLLVDIGGGLGADINEFVEQQGGSLRGRIVLEDLPHVIDAAKAIGNLAKRIETVPFDFFTQDQPLKGSRAYHMHSILHNWPDADCHTILKAVRDAMKPGYSKLLIFDQVVPPQKASWGAMAESIAMSAMFASKERTREEWGKLLKPHGLEISGVWSVPHGQESLIEVEVAK